MLLGQIVARQRRFFGGIAKGNIDSAEPSLCRERPGLLSFLGD
jgi:hypothetical protein